MNENAKKAPDQKRKVPTGKKYRVFGTVPVTVSCVVNLSDCKAKEITEEKLYVMAARQFGGIRSYLGNGGDGKLIGVEKTEETIVADEHAEFDDFMEE